MKLLVLVDGSQESKNAVKKSIEIAKKYDFSIKLIKVVQPQEVNSHKRYSKLWYQVDGSIISGTNELPISPEVRATLLLNEITDTLDFYGIIVEKKVLFGKLAKKVIETAEEENFDLIVLGKKSFSKYRGIFRKTLAIEKIIPDSPCPILLVN